jgi:D-alanyl-D-alanine carboxypeptidase
MSRFDKFLARVLDQAGREARKDGSASVEAHHLLLAVADSEEPTTRRVLASVGLNYAAIRVALDREFGRSLTAAGVSVAAADVPGPSSAREGSPPLGASVKLAMERGFVSVARKKDLRPAHLLLGIVRAQVGTVPRALALAGINQDDLTERIQQTLADTDD